MYGERWHDVNAAAAAAVARGVVGLDVGASLASLTDRYKET